MSVNRILIVDDEEVVARSLKLNLESAASYEIRMENDPAAAIAAAVEFDPDVILMDVMMPGMDGGELAEKFRADPRFSHVPIIFLTAILSNDETQGRKVCVGNEMFMAKPVNTEELIRSIEKMGNPTESPKGESISTFKL
jgi:CheY-like chemotaxis protein